MAKGHESPTTSKVSFNCPRCGAHAHQDWWRIRANQLGKDEVPNLWDRESVDKVRAQEEKKPDNERVSENILKALEQAAQGEVVLTEDRRDPYSNLVFNLSLSVCYSCNKPTLWIHDRIAWPPQHEGPPPNEDLPSDIARDYQEAAVILPNSPRGAAALLRLAIQKLCIHLGESGKNLNADIGSLVGKGLDVRVQRALDIVRVIGNEAVHPGQVDLKDDGATAIELFRLVNLIAETMITQPKQIESMYASLPENKRKEIEKRDEGKFDQE